jgi:hypothetical protein
MQSGCRGIHRHVFFTEPQCYSTTPALGVLYFLPAVYNTMQDEPKVLDKEKITMD